jgi:uncharacterized protein (TIGR01244 family)|tara:strand:+ start:175 stop:612 length:438 start_codon:yes stop_codon:yes gene_type:complete
MHINRLSPDYSVAPQIVIEDVATIVNAGFKSVICNRPDQENPVPCQIEAIKAVALAAGLEFAENVFDSDSFGSDKVERQTELLKQMPGPVLAYCASGNRCSVIWAFSLAGTLEIDTILEATTHAGYQLSHLRPQLENLALSHVAD